MSRLRFAPSPTGFLHIGGLRTALYNYFFAKKTEGKLILRIEDTDPTRTVPGSVDDIISSLDWLGIKFDEGPHIESSSYGPYYQSERLDLYKEQSQNLLAAKKAYYCFCPPKKELFSTSMKPAKRCDCRNMKPEETGNLLNSASSYVLKALFPNQGFLKVEDEIYNFVQFKCNHLDDFVIMKSNGYPTYHLANVVDDYAMGITHVIRGDEWMTSLPKHVLLYQYLNWKLPIFAHLPLLVDETKRTKLSKRNADTEVRSFRSNGYLPQAILNAVALLTYSPPDTEEQILSMQQLITGFELKRVHTSPAGVNFRRIGWFNKSHLELMIDSETERPKLIQDLEDLLNETEFFKNAPSKLQSKEYIESVLMCLNKRIVFLKDLVTDHSYFWSHPDYSKSELIPHIIHITNGRDNLLNILTGVIDKFQTVEFIADILKTKFDDWSNEYALKYGDFMQILRRILTNTPVSIELYQIILMLGKDTVIERIGLCVEAVKKRNHIT